MSSIFGNLMKTLFTIIALQACIYITWGQPSQNEFKYKFIQFQADSGAINSYLHFSRLSINDSVIYQEMMHDGQFMAWVKGERQMISDQSIIIRMPSVQKGKELIALHFLNTADEEVYVYLHLKKGEHMGFEFSDQDIISIERLNLSKGTYLIDWSSPYRSRFYEKIEEKIAHEKEIFQKKITEINLESTKEKLPYYMNNSRTI
jgi:hypothetical protein